MQGFALFRIPHSSFIIQQKMDFSYSKTEQLFLQMIRSFAENEVKPLAAEVDEQERFPMETVEKMGKLGLMGIPIPKQSCAWLPSWRTAPRNRR